MDIRELLTRTLPAPIFFVVILVVQLKIISMLRSHMRLIIYYGKQIEELRKIMTAGSKPHRQPEATPDEHGLYEVLQD